ncbi:cyanoexosortase B system-associated protein [Spirulina sp. CCNP1310]|uniref:cyanoexosortase B system-associated protein n=1 Tax=Spirulina sp. CCNP1310 TaxID=3110249 RepID=UPI002B1F1747|nr:cyanoexosortase B system-associated protein [Spirulina sp. CCNP1310]MEA5420833.1 cyanoexosortase B system-associated protein [Spirulina sp. CCNP1310]
MNHKTQVQGGLRQGAIALLLFLLLIGGMVFNFSGQTSWRKPFPVENLAALRDLRDTGLTLPGWENEGQAQLNVGGREWSVQAAAQRGQRTAIVMILPQWGPKEMPGVEWSDIDGFFRWNREGERSLSFTTTNPPTTVQARYFLARDTAATKVVPHRQTVAVLQWYATPNGGNPSAGWWFWRDQWAQVRRQRIPWVAVSLRFPIDPSSTLEDVEGDILPLAEAVQEAIAQIMLTP